MSKPNLLESLAATTGEDAKFCGKTRAHQKSRRRGEADTARAGDDKYGYGKLQGPDGCKDDR